MSTTTHPPRRTLPTRTTTTIRYRVTPLARATFLCSGCDRWAALPGFVATTDGPRCPECGERLGPTGAR
ncbi:MAG: hypothetical protein HY690_00610 [Chloroflexi bacterium]|nr:hypothetical protein [Chloroflexota bacterium]